MNDQPETKTAALMQSWPHDDLVQALAGDAMAAMFDRVEHEALGMGDASLAVQHALGGWLATFAKLRFAGAVPVAAIDAMMSDFRTTLLANLDAVDALPRELMDEYRRATTANSNLMPHPLFRRN